MRARRFPRLRSLVGHLRRRKGRTVEAPDMTPERAERIERMAAGLTLNTSVDPYDRWGGAHDAEE